MHKPLTRLPFYRLILGLLILAAVPAAAETSPDAVWSDSPAPAIAAAERWVTPERYRSVRLDWPALGAILDYAPAEGVEPAAGAEAILTLPMPHGGFERFQVEQSQVMHPDLAAKFPEIQTFRGVGLDDPHARIYFDRTPQGFHAMVLSPKGAVFVDPLQRGNVDDYASYYKSEYASTAPFDWSCGAEELHQNQAYLASLNEPSEAVRLARRGVEPGENLRDYRTVVAATGEYTNFHGGTVAAGQAAIVTAMNRVNGVYETELAIRMTLVANNNLVVYTNAGTDPYTNNNGFAMLGQNQANLDAVIGSANYDFGHVFSTGGGGVAALGATCNNSAKAQGVTGLGSPTGDPFYIDFVAHEMGHQWGGSHTFNGSSGNCSGGNRSAANAYEPGSGSTIQAYAGICSGQNLQSNSDPYFHARSLDQMFSYSNSGFGSTCGASTATGNGQPVVEAGNSFQIPADTPFRLCGSATDPDGDDLTYAWEQWDLGPTGPPNSPTGNAPIFRSFNPVTVPYRTFPKESDLLNNTSTIGEILPSYSRGLTFRLTARDNQPAAGSFGDDTTTLTVTDTGAGFQVTAPNTAVTWAGGSNQTVTWNRAGTHNAPINCATVSILLSTDGGQTFPITVAGAISNDGSESITVPQAPTGSARLKVLCDSSVFFDLTDQDFTITGGSDRIFSGNFELCTADRWSDAVGLQ